MKMKRYVLPQILGATLLALLMTACTSPFSASASQQATPTSIATPGGSTPTPMPDGLVDVGGRKLRFYCTGQGSPTVILEAGGQDHSDVWSMVQSGGDRSYRVCSYDRANLGGSDAAPKPRAFSDMARDLHALLVNAHLGGPYILVGHS